MVKTLVAVGGRRGEERRRKGVVSNHLNTSGGDRVTTIQREMGKVKHLDILPYCMQTKDESIKKN